MLAKQVKIECNFKNIIKYNKEYTFSQLDMFNTIFSNTLEQRESRID